MKTYTIVKEIRDEYEELITSEEFETLKSEKKARDIAKALNADETDKSITYCILVERYLQGQIAGFEYIEHDEI